MATKTSAAAPGAAQGDGDTLGAKAHGRSRHAGWQADRHAVARSGKRAREALMYVEREGRVGSRESSVGGAAGMDNWAVDGRTHECKHCRED